MRGIMMILGAAFVLCASMTQVTFSHRTLASAMTHPTSRVESPTPSVHCVVRYQDQTKTFVTGGKIFTNIYMKRVSGVCTDEDRPLVHVEYFSPKGNPIATLEQELGKGSSPAKWETIFNSIQTECTGFCWQYCTDPDAKGQCWVEITLVPSTKNKQPENTGTSGFGLGGLGGGGKKPGDVLNTPEKALLCAMSNNPLHLELSFYQTLGDRHKEKVKQNLKLAYCPQNIELPLQ